MADPSVSERRIRPIQDAVASGNWKQALQQCDKWQKKGEKSDKFLALKAHILVNLADRSFQERGLTETIQLCHRTPAVTDLDAIHQLQDTLKELSLQEEEGSKLWERAVAAKPSDKDLLMTWLNRSVADSNWLSAQKAAMALRKAFAKERQYEFWNILLCYLVHKDVSLSEKDRMLFGTLAYRLVSKAAEAVPEDQEQLLSPGKAIATPEELYLLVHIYQATNKASAAVDLLQSTTLGPESRVGKQDPQLVLSLLLETLEASQRWEDAFKICQSLLRMPEHQTDDRIWNLLLLAQRKGDFTKGKDFQQTLNACTASATKPVRSAQLAKLKYLQSLAASENEATDDLLEAILNYYKEYHDKGFCFSDLRRPLQALDKVRSEKMKRYLDSEVSETSSNSNRLFQLKYEYCFSCNENPTESGMCNLSMQALELYHSQLTKASPCPEAALLAAIALLRVAETTDKVQFTLQATLVIETCGSKFEDYYPFSVLLVQCYCNLGLISLAMTLFMKMSVKNMQWETVGHLLLTRISTLHPHAIHGDEEVLGPLGAIFDALKMLEKSDKALVRGVTDGLKYGSYSNIVSSVEMRSDIEHSLNKQLFVIEDRRIDRYLGQIEDTILDRRPENLVDKRDFSFLPNYSDSDDKVHEYLRCGPLPKEIWIDAMALIDHVMNYLKHDIKSDSSIAQIHGRLELIVQRLERSKASFQDELTTAETASLGFFSAIAQIIFAVNDKDSHISPKPDFTTLTKSLQSTLSELLKQTDCRTAPVVSNVQIPNWKYLHIAHVQVEILQGLALFLFWAAHRPGSSSHPTSKSKSKSKTPKPGSHALSDIFTIPKDTATALTTQGRDLEAAIHASAKEIKSALNEPGVLGTLVDVAFGRASSAGSEHAEIGKGMVDGDVFERICDEVVLETVCGSVRESWEDALDGILGQKVNWEL